MSGVSAVPPRRALGGSGQRAAGDRSRPGPLQGGRLGLDMYRLRRKLVELGVEWIE